MTAGGQGAAPEATPEAPPESGVPVSRWIPDDPDLTDVAYWGGLPDPQYAEPGDAADARVELRKRRLLGGHDADVSTPLGQEALAIGRAGRALDGLMRQFAGTTDTGERYVLWQQMVAAAQPAPKPPPSPGPPPPAPAPSPGPTPEPPA